MSDEQGVVQEVAGQSDPLAAQLQQYAERMGMLTIQLVQSREALADKERELAALTAEVQGWRLRIESDDRELLRVRGAVAALQQLAGMQEGGNVTP